MIAELIELIFSLPLLFDKNHKEYIKNIGFEHVDYSSNDPNHIELKFDNPLNCWIDVILPNGSIEKIGKNRYCWKPSFEDSFEFDPKLIRKNRLKNKRELNHLSFPISSRDQIKLVIIFNEVPKNFSFKYGFRKKQYKSMYKILEKTIN